MPANYRVCIAALAAVVVAAACTTTPTAPSAQSDTTTLSVMSEPITLLDQARTYNLQNATFRALSLRSGGALDVTVRPISPSDQSGPWTVLMSSPSGLGLTTGTFSTQPFRADNEWNFKLLHGEDRCGDGNGSVTIHEIAITATTLQRFRASFTVQCEGRRGTLRGNLVVLADPWR